MQPKRFATTLLFMTALVGGLNLGCKPPPPMPSNRVRPLAGLTITVGCPDSTSANLVQSYTRSWCNADGATVRVKSYETAPETGVTADADIWLVPPAALPRLAAAKLLQTVPKSLTSADNALSWTDFLPQYRERLLLWDGAIVAVPVAGEALLCVYRLDLFADAARKKEFLAKQGRPLAPPNTWEEFVELAEFFTKTGAPSVGPLPADHTALDRLFFSMAACYARRAIFEDDKEKPDHFEQLFSLQYDARTGAPRLDAPAFVHALTLLQRLQACRSDAWALAIASVGELQALQGDAKFRDQFGIVRLPGAKQIYDYATGKPVPLPGVNHVPYLGSSGYLAVVPKTSTRADAAFSLLTDLAGRDISAQLQLNPRVGGGPTRREHLERTRWEALEFDAEQTKALKSVLQAEVFTPGLVNPAMRLRIPDEATHTAALMREIRNFLTKPNGRAVEALATARKRWEELDRARGKVLGEYRLSVGLLAEQ